MEKAVFNDSIISSSLFFPLTVVNYNNPDLLTKEVWSSSKKFIFA